MDDTEQPEPRKRTGRRPGSPDTRGQILDVAMRAFTKDGYEKTSVRAVAREAGVDPALVHKFFGDKQQLFIAAIRMSFNPLDVIDRVGQSDPETLGPRIIVNALTVWETRWGRTWLSSLQRMPGVIPAVVGFLNPMLTEVAINRLKVSRAEAQLRAGLIESQIAGLLVLRYIAEIEPLASMSRDELTRIYGPVLQHYITGDVLGRRAK